MLLAALDGCHAAWMMEEPSVSLHCLPWELLREHTHLGQNCVQMAGMSDEVCSAAPSAAPSR